MDPAHRVRIARPQAVPVIVGKKLCLVSGHVHVDGTVAFATLAGEAQVERVEYFFALPSIANHVAVHHFEQQMRTAARGMLFLHRDAIARAHSALLLTAALSDAHTSHGGMRKTALIAGEVKMSGRFFGR